MNGFVPMLFIIAALCLLPAPLVGLAALGAAAGLLIYGRLSEKKKPTTDADHEEKLRRFAAEWAEAERQADLKRRKGYYSAKPTVTWGDHLEKPGSEKVIYLKDRR